MVVSLKVPDANASTSRDEGPNLKVDMIAYTPKKVDSSDLSIKDSVPERDPLKSSLSNFSAAAAAGGQQKDIDKNSSSDKPKPKISFLKRMEQGLDNPAIGARKNSSLSDHEGSKFAKSFFAHFFERLNLRKLS
jgi:hypothetical protein